MDKLTPCQQTALDTLIKRITDRKPLTVVSGQPGTGKSFLLYKLGQYFIGKDSILISAMTNKACSILHTYGIACKTFHSTLGLVPANSPEGFTQTASAMSGAILIIDEYSMLTAPMLALAKETYSCIILIGDMCQLPPIGENIRLPDKTVILELKEQVRQKNSKPVKEFLTSMRQAILQGTAMPTVFPSNYKVIKNFDILMKEAPINNSIVLSYTVAVSRKYSSIGYRSMTIHKAQGSTIETVILHYNDLHNAHFLQNKYRRQMSYELYARLLYVALTRCSVNCIIYTGNNSNFAKYKLKEEE